MPLLAIYLWLAQSILIGHSSRDQFQSQHHHRPWTQPSAVEIQILRVGHLAPRYTAGYIMPGRQFSFMRVALACEIHMSLLPLLSAGCCHMTVSTG